MHSKAHQKRTAPEDCTDASRQLGETFSDVRLVVFDFDGVVADSEILSLSTLKAALARYDLDYPLSEVRDRFLGKSLSAICRHVAEESPAKQADGFGESWQNDLFQAFWTSLRPVPSVLEALNRLDEAGLPYCIASSSTFERLNVALTSMGLSDRIAHIFSAEQVTRGKPEPDLFLKAARDMGVPPETCLVVEDSPFGIQAACRAGMRSIGFVGGQHLIPIAQDHGALLRKLGALHVIDDHDTLFEMGLASGTGCD